MRSYCNPSRSCFTAARSASKRCRSRLVPNTAPPKNAPTTSMATSKARRVNCGRGMGLFSCSVERFWIELAVIDDLSSINLVSLILAPASFLLEANPAKKASNNEHQPKQVSQAELKPSAHCSRLRGGHRLATSGTAESHEA